MNDYPRSVLTKEQLIAMYSGRTPPILNMLNLIESIYAAIDAATASPTPVPYSEAPEDLAAALVSAGLMEEDDNE